MVAVLNVPSNILLFISGVELETDSLTVYDFNLGISDRNYWFNPPPECQVKFSVFTMDFVK